MTKIPLILAILAVIIIVSAGLTVQPVKGIGLVYIFPPSQGTVARGATVTYEVHVSNMPQFNGWDIMVQTDPATSIISPTSISISGNLFAVNFTSSVSELVNCVNGGAGISPGQPGNIGCTAQDGAGIAHSALVATSRLSFTSASGLLFKITYTGGTKSSSTTVLHLFNDLITLPSGGTLLHSSQDGIYGSEPVFTIAPNPTILTLSQGTSGSSTLTLTSVNGFTGSVTLANPPAISNSTITTRPTATVSPTSVSLLSGTATATVNVVVGTSTTPGRYFLIVNATTVPAPGAVPFSVFPVITVLVPDFRVSANPGSVLITPPGTTTGSSTITATSINGFADTVSLTSTVTTSLTGTCPGTNCPSAQLSQSSIQLTSGGSGTSALSISISASTPPGPYTITVVGTNRGLTHQVTVAISVKVQPSLTTVLKDPNGVPVTLMPTGSSIHDTATFTSATSDAGQTVNYYTFTSADCSGAATLVSPALVSNGVIPDSASMTLNQAQTLSWNANYTGDAKNLKATSQCEPLRIQSPPTSPTIVTAIKDSTGSTITSIIVGATVHDNATLSNAFSTAGGKVTYSWWTGSTCTGTKIPLSSVDVKNSIVPGSASVTFNVAGSYSFNATYSGDTQNNPAPSPCEPLTVNKASSAFTTTIKNSIGTAVSAVQAGTMVHDTSALSAGFSPGAVGSTVTYTLFSFATLPSATAPCSSGTTVGTPQTVTITTAGLVPDASAVTPAVGTYGYSATFNGDANNNAATSNCEPLMVTNKVVPSLATLIKDSTGATVTTITVGAVVHDNATLAGATATAGGTVTYAFWNTGGCTGTQTVVSTVTVTNAIVPGSASAPFNTAGLFSWNATYSGDANNLSAISSCEPLTVNKATPAITTTISSATIIVGSSVTDQATLTGGFPTTGVTGTVTYSFFSNGACTAPATSSSTVTVGAANAVPASSSVTPASAGSFAFNAAYSGDTNNSAVTSSCEPLTVNKASPTLSTVIKDPTNTAATSVTVGTVVHDTATLTNSFQAVGSVIYTIFTNVGCTSPGTTVSTVTVTGGLVPDSLATTPTPAGSYSFNATYTGDLNNNPATSLCEPLTILKASPSIATLIKDSTNTVVMSVRVGTVVHGTSTLSSGFQAGGGVTYTIFSNIGCTAPGTTASTVKVTAGVVPDSAPTTPSSAGSYSFQASYTGDVNNNPATSPCEPLTVISAPNLRVDSITVSPDPTSPITVGTKVTFNVVIVNNGTADENFQIWIRWGSVTVANQSFFLASGQTHPFPLTWDTTGYGAATNTISVVVPPVQGETTPDLDNTLQGPSLTLVAAPQPLFSSLLSSPAFYVGLPVAIIIVLIALYLVLRGRKTVTA